MVFNVLTSNPGKKDTIKDIKNTSMSWNIFNKSRPTSKLNIDRQFERDVAKCNELEVNTKKLYKDMKRCNKALTELSKLESKVAQDISNSPLDQGRKVQNHADELAKTMGNLERYRLELTTNVVRTTIEPMKKFNSVFSNVNNGVKKREQCLQEYIRLKAKVEKYKERERTPQNLSKLEQYEEELESAKAEYDAHNAVMLEELPRLWEGRVTYFEPCFEALQKAQVDYYSKCCQAYGDLVNAIGVGTDLTDEVRTQTDVEEMLAEFRSLSIVGNV